MPMDLHAMSASSYFSEGLCYPYERQVGFWKTESMPQNNEGMQHLKFDKHLIGGERIARLLDHESRTISNSYTDPVSYQMDENKANIAAPCYKNDVFSSPLSELLSQKMRLSSNDSLYGHSVCDASNYDEEEPYESLEEIEAQTIGDLLPSDDDLLSGVTDGLDYIAQPSGGDEVEDLELFSSVGGLDLGEEQFNSDISSGQFWGSNYSIPGEQPSRTLIVRNIDSNIEDIELQALFDQYGDICTLYTACKHQGFAMISYYDLRAALNAKKELQNKSLRNRKLDIHFSVPAEDKLLEKDIYEGTLAVTKLEPRYPDGNTRFRHSYPKFKHDEFSSCSQQGPASHGLTTSFGMDNSNIYGVHSSNKAPVGRYHGNAFHHGMSSVPGNLSSIIGADVDGQQATITDSSHLLQKKNMEILNPLIFHQHSLQDYHDDLVSRHTGDGSSASLLPHHYMWNNSLKPHGMMWSNSPSFVNGVYSPQHSQRSHATHSHEVGFGPSVDPALWDRRHVYSGESPDTSSFQPGSLGNVRNSSYSLHPFEFVSPHIFPRVGGNCFGLPVASKGLQSPQQSSAILPSSGQFYPMASPFDSPYERKKGRQNESVSSQVDNKKQYELDVNRIIRCEDKRTTLMIKNIPNKYTSKMLLAAIDEHHRGTYDFIYLPIDFKNKCNVGYAFINMTDPSYIIPFYQAFNGKKWEKFNSEKVASLAYARIQGKAALIAHFQNSSLMNEDKRCRPILFNTEGPNAGDQVPFPMGGNVRSRSTQNRAGTSDQSHSESSVDTGNGEDYSSGDTSSRSSTEAE